MLDMERFFSFRSPSKQTLTYTLEENPRTLCGKSLSLSANLKSPSKRPCGNAAFTPRETQREFDDTPQCILSALAS